MRREQCGGCGSPDLEPFLDLGKTPLADRFPKTAEEPEQWYPLEVAVCQQCWLVQLLEVVPDDVLWSDYGFYSGASPSKVAYHRNYAGWALKEFEEQARRLTVEIACNDGDLLQHFQAAGCRVHGIDPAAGPVAAARERGLRIWESPFDSTAAQTIRAADGQAGLIIANHVAAHVADPHDFFAGISELLAPDGVALIEVQYLPDLLAGNQFDHVYHEHRFYFSIESLAGICRQHGLAFDSVQHTEQQGGSIRVALRRAKGKHFPLAREMAPTLRSLCTYQAFQGRVDYIRDRLDDLLAQEKQAGRRIAGYGATAKSTTLLNYCGIGPDLLEYVEDKTPAKIGRVTPGTHIPIVAPPQEVKTPAMLGGKKVNIITEDRKRPDTYLLLAWNYLPGVLRREHVFLDQGGRLLVPIPMPVLL